MDNLVYHGSPIVFDSETANPKRQVRTRTENGKRIVIFDEESFHATPHKSVALAYTYDGRQTYHIDGRECYYNMGVNLYGSPHEIVVYGFNSLEKSLRTLYGKGGYLYYFDGTQFHWKEGLGDLEVITNESLLPTKVEHIDDPVSEMKKLGVVFYFVDLKDPENTEKRNYKN